ncbi:MAG: MlaD family protein [Gammaproteobacteria bacterium]
MSKQASPTLIGLFVLGATAILVMFVLILAGDSFNRQSQRYVVFFEESVNGLSVGSNVMFRGVPVGVVSNIDVVVNGTSGEFLVPVYIDIYDQSFSVIPGTEAVRKPGEDSLQFLLDLGLRAALKTESLITGRLFINLDFFPDQEIVLRGFNNEYKEIPSIKTGIEAFIEKTQTILADFQEGLNVRQFGEDLAGVTSGLNELLNNPETQALTGEMNATLVSLRDTLDNANNLLSGAESSAEPLTESIGVTLRELETLLTTINNRVSETSDTTYRLNATLQEIEGAARSIRILAEYLEANPEALVTGKGSE